MQPGSKRLLCLATVSLIVVTVGLAGCNRLPSISSRTPLSSPTLEGTLVTSTPPSSPDGTAPVSGGISDGGWLQSNVGRFIGLAVLGGVLFLATAAGVYLLLRRTLRKRRWAGRTSLAQEYFLQGATLSDGRYVVLGRIVPPDSTQAQGVAYEVRAATHPRCLFQLLCGVASQRRCPDAIPNPLPDLWRRAGE